MPFLYKIKNIFGIKLCRNRMIYIFLILVGEVQGTSVWHNIETCKREYCCNLLDARAIRHYIFKAFKVVGEYKFQCNLYAITKFVYPEVECVYLSYIKRTNEIYINYYFFLWKRLSTCNNGFLEMVITLNRIVLYAMTWFLITIWVCV